MQTLLSRIRSGLIEDGTAIGNGLATAINRLRESEAKSKVIILLTDGVNNHGEIAPLTAAEIAKAQGIRVYTIGVGTEGMAPYPAVDIYGTPTGGTVMAKVEIDEKTLRYSRDDGREYFRATDKAKLKAIYDQINQLEKSKVEVTEHVTYQHTSCGRWRGCCCCSRSSCSQTWCSNGYPDGHHAPDAGKALPLPEGKLRRECRCPTSTQVP